MNKTNLVLKARVEVTFFEFFRSHYPQSAAGINSGPSTHHPRNEISSALKPSRHCLRKMFTNVHKSASIIYCFLKNFVVNTCVIWFRAVSSVGRASRLHRGGQRFESFTAHQNNKVGV